MRMLLNYWDILWMVAFVFLLMSMLPMDLSMISSMVWLCCIKRCYIGTLKSKVVLASLANCFTQEEKVSKMLSQVQCCHGLRELRSLLGLQKAEPRVIPRDIKSSNVLIFDDMLLRLPLLTCQIKPLIWQHVFIPLMSLELLVIMLQNTQ